MITVNQIGNSITGSINGKPYGVNFSQEKYDQLVALQKQSMEVDTMEEFNSIVDQFVAATTQSFDETVATVHPNIHVNQTTGKFYLKEGDKVSKFPMPQSFVDRILKSVDKNIDVTPLIKLWTRILRNPNLTAKKAKRLTNYVAKTYVDQELVAELVKEGVSKEVAVERATSYQVSVTQEGLLVTYKVSREIKHRYEFDENGNKVVVPRYTPNKTIDDITGVVTVEENLPQYVEDRIFEPAVVGQSHDAFFCGDKLGHVIRVGQRHFLEKWDQVNTNDDQSCVKGLHVGNLDYIRGYQNSGTETHNIFVDPMYVGAVTDDGSGALRVKEYFVFSSFAGVNKSIYHSSKYAAVTDAAYAQMRIEAIEASNKLKAEVDQQIADMPE